MNHKVLQKKVTDRLARELPGLWHLNVHGSKWQRKWIPDTLFTYKGKPFAIEFNVDGDGLSPIQKLEMENMVISGWICYVISYTNFSKIYNLSGITADLTYYFSKEELNNLLDIIIYETTNKP